MTGRPGEPAASDRLTAADVSLTADHHAADVSLTAAASSISFTDRGLHEMKGLADQRRVYLVTS